ncbi:MAG: TolC family protein [Gammaproteobacteria bacterium]|nr:TolC family protein [Gammaproteobacteria bacterium]
MKGTIVTMLLLAAVCSAPAKSESLAEAWALALKNDRTLAAVRLEAEAARFEATAARGLRYPALTTSASAMQFADAPAFDFSAAGVPIQMPRVFDHDNTVIGNVSVMLPLYTGGRITNEINAADENRRAREAMEAQAIQQTKLEVAEAYVGVLRAQRALDVANSNVANLEAYVGEVRAMFEREMVPRNDLLAAQVALANAEQGRLRASNALDLAKASYNRRLGAPLTREVQLEPTLPVLESDFERVSVDELIARALDQRNELVALQAQANAMGYRADVERARLRPQLALSGGYSYLESEMFDRERFASASLTMSWPLFDGGVTRHRSAALRRTQRALEERRADLETQIALETRQAWLDLQEARNRARVTAEAVAQSEENLRLARRQYQAGLVTITRVLEAESLRVTSRTNHDNALLDADLAVYRLARVLGEL